MGKNPDRKPEEDHQERQVVPFLDKQVFVFTGRQVPIKCEAGTHLFPKAGSHKAWGRCLLQNEAGVR